MEPDGGFWTKASRCSSCERLVRMETCVLKHLHWKQVTDTFQWEAPTEALRSALTRSRLTPMGVATGTAFAFLRKDHETQTSVLKCLDAVHVMSFTVCLLFFGGGWNTVCFPPHEVKFFIRSPPFCFYSFAVRMQTTEMPNPLDISFFFIIF